MEDTNNQKVKLTVMGISYSPMQTGAFAMLLAEENGPKRLPVVIGSAEAQSIAIKLENVTTPRPITHDLFCSLAQAYGLKLVEVFIYKFEDGIFSSELTFTNGEREVKLDSRTSDAVAIAVRTNSPIYTTRAILDEVGTTFDENDERQYTSAKEGPNPKKQSSDPASLSDAELQQLLNKHIEEENYEEAAKISEILKSRKAQ